MIALADHHALTTALRSEWLRSGLTLAEIGRRMGGVSPQGVHDLLNGHRDLRTSSGIKLANALGYDLALVSEGDS